MTHEQQARWHRIRDFQIDAPNASFSYSSRLARENGWTPAYAARVIEEYRKFAFLAVEAGHGVTPSKEVDAAWHLHLLYTRNYWEAFCPDALGRPLHHHPSGGTAEDEAKYEGWYERTIESYERLFGEDPPTDVWPRDAKSTKIKRRWLPFLGLFALSLSGCEEGPNPLDWHGPVFLQFIFVVYVIALFGAFFTRRALMGKTEGPPASDWQLTLYEQAYLHGGEHLTMSTALVALMERHLLEADGKTRKLHTVASGAGTDVPLERAILKAAETSKGISFEVAHQRAKPFLIEMEQTLRRQGLWVRQDHLLAATLLPFALASLPLILGVIKILIGISRERPVGFLIVGCLVGLLVNFFLLASPKISPYGEVVLETLRAKRGPPRRTAAPDDLAFGLALFGMATLDQSQYGDLRPVLTPAASSSGSDGGSSSSCGGGGGCGGGGCGGCGS